MNTIEFVRIPAMMVPEKVCLVYGHREFTYEQLLDRIQRLAAALASLGVGKGDRVAILQTNCNEYVEAYYATALLGGVFVPLNFRARQEELTHLITNSDTSVLLVGDRYISTVRELKGQWPNVHHYISIDKREPDFLYYNELLENADPDSVFDSEVDESDCTILMYTSGTTALPKGVILTFGGFSEYIFSSSEPASDEDQGATLLAVPIYHVAGASAIMTSMYSGRKLVLMRQFHEKEWLEIVQREKITHVFLVPTMMKRLMDDPNFAKTNLDSLQTVSYGAAPMPTPVILRAIEKFPKHVNFLNAFGQTETTSTVTMLGPDDHRLEGSPEEIEKKTRRLQSIGRTLDDVELAILDDDGKPLPHNSVGELALRLPRQMAGYWKQEEATSSTIRDGWVHTRDMGWIDEDGYVFLAGRKSDMIIRGGENIAPEEIESVLHIHPAIEDVAVIGIPDEEWGERVAAIIVRKADASSTADAFIQFCKERMASFKAPEIIEFVDELPRNAMGKILKKDLREQFRNSKP